MLLRELVGKDTLRGSRRRRHIQLMEFTSDVVTLFQRIHLPVLLLADLDVELDQLSKRGPFRLHDLLLQEDGFVVAKVEINLRAIFQNGALPLTRFCRRRIVLRAKPFRVLREQV